LKYFLHHVPFFKGNYGLFAQAPLLRKHSFRTPINALKSVPNLGVEHWRLNTGPKLLGRRV